MTDRMTTDWDERYRSAEALMRDPEALVPNGSVRPRWIDASTFWYQRLGDAGAELRIVDALTPGADRRFSLDKLTALVTSPEAQTPKLTVHASDAEGRAIVVSAGQERWQIDAIDETVVALPSLMTLDHQSTNPQGTASIAVLEHNLHLTHDGATVALTTDGTADHAYASAPLAARHQHEAAGTSVQGLWSPDGASFLTLRTDERLVETLPLLEYLPEHGIRPEVRLNRTSLPGDEHITSFELLVVDVASGEVRSIDHDPQPAIRMNDTIFSAEMAWWSADSTKAYFVHVSRGEARAEVVEYDPGTGATRVLFAEESETYIDLSTNVYSPALIVPLPKSGRVVWFSERSGHGHLYLYDLASGVLVRQLTDGPWMVRDVLAVDDQEETLFALAGGYPGTATPYQTRVVSIDIATGQSSIRALRDDEGTHAVFRPMAYDALVEALVTGERVQGISGFSPGANYFVDTISSLEGMPHTILCDRDGRALLTLEDPSPEALPDEWTWPVPISGLAKDGTTQVFGLMFLPRDYREDRSYPVIDVVYGGPQVHTAPEGAFGSAFSRRALLEALALAQLGAFVTIIDGRGTSDRDRAFHETSWRSAHEASSLDDHVEVIRSAAERYPQMDLTRVGITGFSAGGYASALGAFRHGDFYRVAVAGGGNYDQSLFWHTWGERYHGAYDADHYATQAAKSYVDGFTGKILFIHGLRDHGCHPAALFQLLQRMIEANVDYDLVLLPAEGHTLGGYGQRRRMDYFVTNLFGSQPPSEHRSFMSATDEVAAALSAAALNLDEGDADA